MAHAAFLPEVRHPVEVTADQSEHLIQWLSKRLERPLKVPQLSAQGWELMGGRLLPGEQGPRAQIHVQDAAGQRVTLYIGAVEKDRPASQETAFSFSGDERMPGFYWVDRGFGYAITGKLPRQALLELATSVTDSYRPEEAAATPRLCARGCAPRNMRRRRPGPRTSPSRGGAGRSSAPAPGRGRHRRSARWRRPGDRTARRYARVPPPAPPAPVAHAHHRVIALAPQFDGHGAAAVAPGVLEQVAHGAAQQLGHALHHQGPAVIGRHQLRARPRAFLGGETGEVHRLDRPISLSLASSRLASRISSTSWSSSAMLRWISSLKAGDASRIHQLQPHADARQRRAQLVRRIGQQRLVRLEQRFHPLGRMVEAAARGRPVRRSRTRRCARTGRPRPSARRPSANGPGAASAGG